MSRGEALVMRPTLFSLVAIALFSVASLAPAQTPTSAPTAVASPTPKLTRAQKKAAKAAARSEATPASSPETAASPAATTPTPPPVAKSTPAKRTGPAANATPAPGGGPGLVWVNTKDHVYHQASSRWYGKTKQGKYLSEKDALAEGDKAAGHGE